MLRSPLARKLLLILAAVFFLLRFVHLTADYPRNIRWDDGIATDEGWYASAAVNEHTWGTPRLPGDMNIPVIMPLWSLIAEAAFRIGGFSVVTLRVVAILFFTWGAALCCLMLRRYGARDWIPLFLAMFALNPWAFAFSRAAFLEFPMLSFCLLAVVLVPARNSRSDSKTLILLRIVLAGVSFALAMLLKTTAVALAPVLVYVLFESSEYKVRRTVRDLGVLFGTAGVIYGAYWLLVVRPHMVDVQFYLSVVKNTLRFTLYGFIADTSRPFRYGLGSDHLLFALSLIVLVATLLSSRMRAFWKEPLFAVAGVWLVSFLGFMVKHNNDPSRYFAITIPASLFVGIVLLRNADWTSETTRRVLTALVAADIAINGVQVVYGLLHARYSFHNAAVEIAQVVRGDSGNGVVIGDEIHEVALHNGLRPVNLLFHSDSVMEQMHQYRPQWWLQFAPIDDGSCYRDVLSAAYSAERRGRWQIFYEGQELILWKLTPKAGGALPTSLTPNQEAECKPPVYN